MITARFTNELDHTGYGPRRVVDVDYRTVPTFTNGGWANFTCCIDKVRVDGKVPYNFETTDYRRGRTMGWVTARFQDGSTTSIFLSRNGYDSQVFSVCG